MGCTSSAPNMVTATDNPTDKIIHFSEDVKDQIHQNEMRICTDDGNRTFEKVLPPCDTLDESIQLDRNNKSLIDTQDMHVENDSYVNGHVNQGGNTQMNNDDSQVEEKLSSLEDVVDKVVELYIADSNEVETNNIAESLAYQINEAEQTCGKAEAVPDEHSEPKFRNEETKPVESLDVKIEDAISPSQSTSSRATRWEALADIAAELPPSLAVDPVTGQIYALSK